MGLNAKQKEAVEYLDGSLLVVAGPGTGKTQLLSSKVAYILENTDTAPENILCLTFTDSGATTMRERLKSMIGKDANKVHIGTYHTFGTDILNEYKDYSDEYDRNLDHSIDEIDQYKIVRTIQGSLDGRDILRGDSVDNIISAISEAKNARLTSSDLEIIAKQNIADSEVLSEAIGGLLSNIVPRKYQESYDNAYGPIYELIKKYCDEVPLIELPSGIKVARLIYEVATGLRNAIEEAGGKKIKPLTSWKDAYFELDGKGDYRLKGRVANKKLFSLANVMQKYEEHLRKNGLYDFSDMILEASKVLERDEGFKLTLEERYQFILLDEFQDTNPAQLNIVKLITDYEKPNIMAVGDDDQAIYAFQGALASNLTDFKEHYNAKEVNLEENYRSTQEILDFSQEIIKQADDRYGEKHLTAHKPNPKKSQIERHEFRTSDTEYAYIAKRINDLICSGVPQSEIAVISYKTKYFEPLLPYLKAYPEIKIAYEKQNDLLADPRIHQLVTLSRYVVDMAKGNKPSVSIVEILGYSWFGLSALEVMRTVEAARSAHQSVFEALAASDNPKIQRVAEFIAKLAVKSFTEPLEIMLDYMTGARELDDIRSDFLATYASDEQEMFSLYENLAALRGKVNKHFKEKALKLVDLIEMIDDYEVAGKMLASTSPYREAESAVEILTAHKAKGMEFKYVFIISADHSAWGKGKGNNNTLTLPKNMAFIRHTGITDGEKLRILYVALTRAKDALIITNSLHDFAGKEPSRLEYFDEYTEGDKVIMPILPTKEVELDYDLPDLKTLTQNVQNWFSPFFEESPELHEYYLRKAQGLKMSSTALTSFIDVVYGGPVEFFKGYIMPSAPEPDSPAMAFGSLIHSTFEHVSITKCSDEEAVRFFLEELEKIQLPLEDLKRMRDKGPEDLLAALKAFGELVRKGKPEVNFRSERLVVDGVPVTGSIDLMTVDDENKTIEVYDYKTATYSSKDWNKTASLYKYSLQLQFYKMLLNISPKYHKYKVSRGHILFVTPDKDGHVYDKVFDFDAADDKDFRRLLVAVYEQVSTLKFMNDPELFIEPDGGLDVKDIQAFVELILAKSQK